MTASTSAPATYERPPAHLNFFSGFRPFLGVLLPWFPFATKAGQAARAVGWSLYGSPLVAPYVALWQALIVAANWFIIWPVVRTTWTFSAALYGALGLRVVLVAAFMAPFLVVAYFVARRHDPKPWLWIGVAAVWMGFYGNTLYKLDVAGLGVMTSVGLFLFAADQFLTLSDDRWYLRRKHAITRRRHPIIWSITANKTSNVQAGAVGGGESGGPFENVAGGRLEFDHPALGMISSFNTATMTVTTWIKAPPGRTLASVQASVAEYGAQDNNIRAIDIVWNPEFMAQTWGKMTISYEPRPDLVAMWRNRKPLLSLLHGKASTGGSK